MKKTLDFLKKIKKNNNRDWFLKNKPVYEEAKQEFEKVIADILVKSIQFDKKLAGLEAKKTLFRINRDVRFSKDKSPYKTNFGAFINSGGKNSPLPGYYLHVEPGKAFIAGSC